MDTLSLERYVLCHVISQEETNRKPYPYIVNDGTCLDIFCFLKHFLAIYSIMRVVISAGNKCILYILCRMHTCSELLLNLFFCLYDNHISITEFTDQCDVFSCVPRLLDWMLRQYLKRLSNGRAVMCLFIEYNEPNW